MKREINFEKADVVDDVLDHYFMVWEVTKDTPDYVPGKYLKWVDKFIFKQMKRTVKYELRSLRHERRREKRLARKDKNKIKRSELNARIKGLINSFKKRFKK